MHKNYSILVIAACLIDLFPDWVYPSLQPLLHDVLPGVELVGLRDVGRRVLIHSLHRSLNKKR